MACIIAPAVYGAIFIVIINSGFLFIRRAYGIAKNNPVSVSIESEKRVVGKIDKRLAVRVTMGDVKGGCRGRGCACLCTCDVC